MASGTFITFGIFAAEKDGKPVAKVGASGKAYALDFSDPATCNPLYDEIVEKTKLAFDERRNRDQNPIGFIAQMPPDQ